MESKNVVIGSGDDVSMTYYLRISNSARHIPGPHATATTHFYRPHQSNMQGNDIPEALFDKIAQLGPLGKLFASVFKPEEAHKTVRYNWLMRSVQLDRHRFDEALNVVGIPVVLMGDAAHRNHALVHGVELGECLTRHGVDRPKAFYDGAFKRWRTGIGGSRIRIKAC
jgi:hypothetical protein